MKSKKEVIDIDNAGEEIVKEVEFEQPIKANKNGYINIKLKGKPSIIGIHESQYGTVYKEDKWEIVGAKKK